MKPWDTFNAEVVLGRHAHHTLLTCVGSDVPGQGGHDRSGGMPFRDVDMVCHGDDDS